MDNTSLYKDIKARTGGEIYIGVVGPVRTGKSTFIRKFMELMVVPSINDASERKRVVDELPQAAVGRTVMTTEPKFVPKSGVEIPIAGKIKAKVRLIDCVGYLVENVGGIYEDEKERMVKTPWFSENIPFSEAAEVGTTKVITDHSTIGIVITTDGSIGEIAREGYVEAENKAIEELKRINKPFVVLVNSAYPESEFTKRIVEEISNRHKVSVLAINADKMNEEDIDIIFRNILYEFPIETFDFKVPSWAMALPDDNPIKAEIILNAKNVLNLINGPKSLDGDMRLQDCQYITSIKTEAFDFTKGCVKIEICIEDKWYFKHLSELTGEDIPDDYTLINLIKQLSISKKQYDGYIDALLTARNCGYGVVVPRLEEIKLYEPELIRNGNKYGVKIKAESPSLQLIKVNIVTEISPIVGSKEQASDLLSYIKEGMMQGNVWDTNIFGKTIGNLVSEGIETKLQMINDDCKQKLMDTMQKVVNETSNGIICLII